MTNAALLAWSIVFMVARILTGEIGVVPEAAIPVAQVAYERIKVGWGYEGWYAIADEPADWALDAAWKAWRMGGSGNLYAISGADLEALEFDKRNWENVGSTRWPLYVGEVWR